MDIWLWVRWGRSMCLAVDTYGAGPISPSQYTCWLLWSQMLSRPRCPELTKHINGSSVSPVSCLLIASASPSFRWPHPYLAGSPLSLECG